MVLDVLLRTEWHVQVTLRIVWRCPDLDNESCRSFGDVVAAVNARLESEGAVKGR
jgi:hypothetical protein